jgi:hypothetical protein
MPFSRKRYVVDNYDLFCLSIYRLREDRLTRVSYHACIAMEAYYR